VGANPQLLRCLEINYRSTAPILAAAQVVLARNARPRPKVLRPPPPPPGAPPPPPPPPVVVAEAGTPQDEAAWIADRIEEHAAAGVPFAQQAVLFRFFRWGGTAYGPLKAELDRRNIPNKLLRERTLMKRAAVQHAMAYLRLALDPHDDDAFRVAVNVPPKGVGPAALASLEQSQRECRARGRRRSLFECAGRVGGAGEVAQALRGVRRLLLGLSRAAMHMRPAEVLYEALRASGYVAWADAESARAHFVGDGALSEVEDDEDDYASEGDEEEEAQDAAAEAALGEAEEDGSDDDGGAGGDEEVVPGRRRRRAPAPAPAPDATAAAPARAPPRPRPRDPLAPYGFDLSGFRARCSPLRRLLREAALFSQTWTYGDNAAEAGFAAGRGPPSLFRAAYVAALAAPGGAAATALGGDAQEHGARLGLGPLVLAEFLSFVQEADSEGASAVDRNNVTLSTIHSAKGLEWPVVFCARWNQGFTPSNYWVRDDAPPEPGPPAEPTLPGFRPPVGVDPAAAHAEEERRLAHVAVTRARRHLYIS
jgi:superfamily I DNA/RNA helicase